MISDFKFAVLGDTRGKTDQINKPVLAKLLHDIRKYHDPNFILFGGDMILGRTTPNVDTNNEFIFSNLMKWQEFIKKALGVNSLKGYVFPAIGNHDYSNSKEISDSLIAFNKAFSYIPSNAYNKEMLEGYGKTVYYFDCYNSRFIVLNTVFKNLPVINPTGKKQELVGITKEQLDYLEKVLSTSKKANNFVMMHCPIIGTIDDIRYKDYYSLPINQQEALFRIFNKYKVSALYSGHEHNYNRRIITNVFYENYYELNKSVMQITSGAGGAPFEKPGNSRVNIVNNPLCVYEYAIVEVCGKLIKSTVYDINGMSIDRFISY